MKKHWTSSIALGLFSAMAVVGCGEVTSGSPDAETTEQGSSSAVGEATDEGDSSGPGGPTSVSSSGPSSTTSTDGSDTDTGAGAGAPSGFYVWWRKVTEDGSGGYTVDQEITEEDMEWKVGPTGWPGCPEGVSCTRYGIEMVGFEPTTGRYHFQRAVTTGSDYQKYGSYTFDEGAVEVALEQDYSCAHPSGGPYDTTETLSFTANVDADGLLWLQDFQGAGAGQYWIYRPITSYDAHHVYWWYYCGGPADQCQCLCSSTDFLNDWDCYL